MPSKIKPTVNEQPEEISPSTPVEVPSPVDAVAPTSSISAGSIFDEQSLTTNDERTWAMLAHLSVLLNLVTGFLGPITALILFFVYKDRSRFVAYHALQSFLNQLIWWVGGGILAGITWAISTALMAVLVGFICMPVACIFTFMPIVAMVYGIVGGVQTSQGQDFKYWLIGDWTRKTLTG